MVFLPARCSTNSLTGMLPLQVSLLIILEAGVGWGEQRRKSRVVKLACWNLFSLSQSRKIKKGEKRLSNLNLLSVQSASLGPAPSSCWVPLPASLELTATVQTKKGNKHAGTILSAVWVSLVLTTKNHQWKGILHFLFEALACNSLPF